MDVIQLKKEYPKAMLQNIMQVVVEGDVFYSSLHENTGEFRKIFTMVND
jgi:hypothetical protein